MRNFLLSIILSICLSTLLQSQHKMAVVDFDTLVTMLVYEYRVDSMYQSAEIALTNESARRFQTFQEHYIEFQRMQNGCLSPSAYEKLMRELKQKQDSLIAFEKIITDSLPALHKMLLADMERIIEQEVKAFSASNQFDLIASKRKLLFSSPEIDKTGEIRYRIRSADISIAIKEKIDAFVATTSDYMSK
ncbi:MAG TPA: OmpH family outer membrane protein [Saprospiraceae bacterium]|nr:OmpH family outer membrane protein [Saprospiraceae bacterium]